VKFYPVSKEELNTKGAILLENVREGFNIYPFFFVEGKAEQLQQFLIYCLHENEGLAYADFYYGNLTQEQQEQFFTGLMPNERECMDCFEIQPGQVYYPLIMYNLPFFSDITARSWLFSTFYFTRKPCTVWGNYDGKYPVFCKDEETLQFYQGLAKKTNIL